MRCFTQRMKLAVCIFRYISLCAFVLLISALLPVKAQWKAAKLPFGYDNGYYLDVYFLPTNPQYGWVSGMEGKVLRTSDGGATWIGSVVPTSGNMLESIQFVTTRIGYTSGPTGIWKSIDGGVTWSEITPNTSVGFSFWGCYFVNQQVGVFLGGVCGGPQYFFRTTDGGGSWNVFIGNQQNTKLSDAILESATGRGYASSSGLIWQTNDGGISWSFLSNTGTFVWQEEITHLGNSILVPASGIDCDGQSRNVGEMRFSTDEGKSWRNVQTGRSMFGAFLNSSTSGWGVGDAATVVHTIDAGRTWQLVNCGIPDGKNIDDIWFINDTTGWCVGEGVYQYMPEKGMPVRIQASKKRICAGDSIQLTASDGFDRYLWSNGKTDKKITVSVAGAYRVSAYIDAICYVATDSISIETLPAPAPILQINRAAPGLCKPGDSIIISAQKGFASYRWNTGETTLEITVKSPGLYSVTVIDSNGCVGISQPIAINKSDPFKPQIKTNRKATFCKGDSVMLYVLGSYHSYLWNTGETSTSITVNKSGNYRVTVVDSNGCDGTSDSVEVNVLDIQNRLEFSNIISGVSEFSFDSTALGKLSCKHILLRNRDSLQAVVIEQPMLLHNILFSLRQSELPLAIPPLGEASLTICYAAVDSGLVRDTLIISDTCSPNFLPLRGYGLPLPINGNSHCNIPLKGDVFALGDNFRITGILTNYSFNSFLILYSYQGEKSNFRSARLVSLLGNEVGKISWKIDEVTIEQETGEINIDSQGLFPGAYILFVTIGDKSVAMPLFIE